MEEKRNAYRILVGKSEGKFTFVKTYFWRGKWILERRN